jgi:hypothetical protein
VAFKAVIHAPAGPEPLQEIHKTIDKFRAEKAIKYLEAVGATPDTLQKCLQQAEIHNTHKMC